MRGRVFAIDVDGTLLTSDHRVSEATRVAVAEARRAGYRVVLASARPPRAMRDIVRELELTEPDVFVSSQGALTGSYSVDGALTVLRQDPIPVADAGRVVALAADLGLTINWFAGEGWWVSGMDEQVRAEEATVGIRARVADLTSLESPPHKLMIIAPSATDNTLAEFGRSVPLSMTARISHPAFLEITRRGIGKHSAIALLCEEWAIPLDDVIAIGDGLNDLDLFAVAGTSVAPANAHPAVLAAADHVTGRNDDDGVADAISRIVRGMLPRSGSDVLAR